MGQGGPASVVRSSGWFELCCRALAPGSRALHKPGCLSHDPLACLWCREAVRPTTAPCRFSAADTLSPLTLSLLRSLTFSYPGIVFTSPINCTRSLLIFWASLVVFYFTGNRLSSVSQDLIFGHIMPYGSLDAFCSGILGAGV